MTTDRLPLLAVVVDLLGRHRIAFALIGASALALRGVSRSTMDIDLLVSDDRVLAHPTWAGVPDGVDVDVRRGERDDPLAGVVRVRAGGARDVDVIVGRSAWQAEAIARAEPAVYGGVTAPVVRSEDLILLKLYAGGSQDRWDIEQLLAGPDRIALIERVERHLAVLPERARRLWTTLRGE